jgi:hypothetical protein
VHISRAHDRQTLHMVRSHTVECEIQFLIGASGRKEWSVLLVRIQCVQESLKCHCDYVGGFGPPKRVSKSDPSGTTNHQKS